jgi:hypothetical protein
MNLPIRLELAIPSQWTRIDSVRQAVSLCLSAVFGDVTLKDSLAMVSAELLENAIKYGEEGGVTLSIGKQADRLVIEVTNGIASSSHTRSLEDRIAWLRGFESPSEAYLAALARVYEQSTVDHLASGLGIVRIAYEGGCEVDCYTPAPGQVTVRASCAIPPSG